jgi:hypothetical protein
MDQQNYDNNNETINTEQSLNNNKRKRQSTKWDNNSIKALLAFLSSRKQEIIALNKSRGRTNPNHPFWLECSNHLLNQYKLGYTQEQCYNKFKNLTASHKVFF